MPAPIAAIKDGYVTTRLHPRLNTWHQYNLYDGTIYIDPECSTGAAILGWARWQTVNQLYATLPELGRGSRGIVFAAGSLVIKKCLTDIWPKRTGLEAIAANAILATALRNKPQAIGDYTLRGCMPRGYFDPYSYSRGPMWLMDRAPGVDAQEAVALPLEATELLETHRNQLCQRALSEQGFDPSAIFLDSVPSNLVVDTPTRTLTVIDVMAA
jgi:hypothetical protein